MSKKLLLAILITSALLLGSVLLAERRDHAATIQLPALARLLHDSEWMGYPSRSAAPGWRGLSAPPETVPLLVAPKKSAGKDDVRLSQAWLDYLDDLNSDRAEAFILTPKAGWFNSNTSADSIGFGGNVVLVDEIVGRYARIRAFNFSSLPPDAADINFQTAPFLVHKFTVTTRTGDIINPGPGLDVYIFLIGRGSLYVPLERIEFCQRPPKPNSGQPCAGI